MSRNYVDCDCVQPPNNAPAGTAKHYTDADGVVWHCILSPGGDMFWNTVLAIPREIIDAKTAKDAAKAAKQTRHAALVTKLDADTITNAEQKELLRLIIGSWTPPK